MASKGNDPPEPENPKTRLAASKEKDKQKNIIKNRNKSMSDFCKAAGKVEEDLKLKDIQSLQDNLPILKRVFSQLESIHKEVCTILQDEDERTNWSFQFKMMFNHYNYLVLTSDAFEKNLEDNSEDNLSVCSSTSNNSATDKYTDAVSKCVGLEQELEFLDEETKLATHLKKLQLRKELYKAKAEKDALLHMNPNIPVVQDYPIHVGPQLQPRSFDFSHHLPGPQVRVKSDPVQNQQSENAQIVNLIESLRDLQQTATLAPEEPDVFDGSLLDFPVWLRDFENLIEQNVKTPSQRLRYLRKYTSGEAKESIKGFMGLTTPDAYQDAKQTLITWYGNPSTITKAYKKKLRNWPIIKTGDNGKGIKEFSHFLQTCLSASKSHGYMNSLDDDDLNQIMSSKLPKGPRDRWSTKVLNYEIGRRQFPPFSLFCDHVQYEARLATQPVAGTGVLDKIVQDNKRSNVGKRNMGQRTPAKSAKTLSTSVLKQSEERISPSSDVRCYFCQENSYAHSIEDCFEFSRLMNEDKLKFLKQNGICFACLEYGHMSRICQCKKTCKTCNKKHPTVLHANKFVKVASNETVNQANCRNTNTNICSIGYKRFARSTRIVPVWISTIANPQNRMQVYALLDEQSDTTFITDEVQSKLSVSGPSMKLKLSTMATSMIVDVMKINGLRIEGIRNPQEIKLPPCYTRRFIPASHSQIPTRNDVKAHKEFRSIVNELPDVKENCPIGILIGTDCMEALKPLNTLTDKATGSYAVQTKLGWSIVGLTMKEHVGQQELLTSHKIVVLEVHTDQLLEHSFVHINKTKEVLSPSDILSCLHQDFVIPKIANKCTDQVKYGITRSLSVEDKRFLAICQQGIHRTTDGHYEMPLPFRNQDVHLPNNKTLAFQRLKSIRKKFSKDEKYRMHYCDFMDNLLQCGYAEKVPLEEIGLEQAWYIPHHGVYHPHKPNKIRVVFDCSAEYYTQSLNKMLLPGPDLTNTLVGVLLRFRKENIAVMGDIESMYHQVKVNKEHRDYLRFLWWPDGDANKPSQEYRMCSHLFGAVSSPGCANFALKTTALENDEPGGTSSGSFLQNNFYVDDGIISMESPHKAIELVHGSKKLCAKGGFRLTKFSSNSKEVLESLDVEDLAPNIKSIDLNCETLPVERALGIQWTVEDDSFTFSIKIKDKPLTRRGILSSVASVFDPHGFLAPVLLEGKQILQQLCKDGCQWDDNIPESLSSRWIKWKGELHKLDKMQIRRCIKPSNFGKVLDVQLHHFSDAAQSGYGQCSYIRLVNEKNKVHCSLIFGKSRVVPKNSNWTIPRLELNAALVSVKVANMLEEELHMHKEYRQFYWTDSKVVLGYIQNETKRFHVFVSNRVGQIRESSDPSQWFYIDTKENPADDCSRGISVKKFLSKNNRYLNGPSFLWKPSLPLGSDLLSYSVDRNDPEVKDACTNLLTTANDFSNFVEHLKSFSNWNKMKKFAASWLRIRNFLENKIKKKENIFSKYFDVKELMAAETLILKKLQAEIFSQELKLLKNKKEIYKNSPLYKLDVFLDKEDLIRAGGRISHSDMSWHLKYPVVLTKTHSIATAILNYFHDKVRHQGRGMTLNEIRNNGLWILQGVSAVASLISKCVICKRLRGQVQDQKMSDLPEDRLKDDVPPFTYVGMDVFGPFVVKERRCNLKRYGLLFTCLCSRAIRIEILPTLETDTFINGLRRFICRNGPARHLRCDQGTNFVGASRELKDLWDKLNQKKITNKLLDFNCDFMDFKFNSPYSSHMGGVWERQIRTIRSVLNSILQSHGSQFNEDMLQTYMAEVEAIVNSRPLTTCHLGTPDTLVPLSPQHLLTMKTKLVYPPPGNFDRADLYLRKRWRRVQHLADEFWQRWRKEYMQNLQIRQKWNKKTEDMQKGDVVLIADQASARNTWKIAVVEDTFLSSDASIRRVLCKVVDPSSINKSGKRVKQPSFLERPIHKLILLHRPNKDNLEE